MDSNIVPNNWFESLHESMTRTFDDAPAGASPIVDPPKDWTPLTLDVARSLVGHRFEAKPVDDPDRPIEVNTATGINTTFSQYWLANDGGEWNGLKIDGRHWLVRVEPAEPDPYDTIHAAMDRFVGILCDGAWGTDGDDAHEDVIALAYAMPPHLTDGWDHERGCLAWGAWRDMVNGWLEDGRAPDVVRNREPAEGWVTLRGEISFHVGDDITELIDALEPVDIEPMVFTGPFLDTFHSNPAWAATLVAKVIADGLDDELLVLWWDLDDRREGEDLAAMELLLELGRLADDEQRARLMDHIEAALDVAEAEESKAWRLAIERFVPGEWALIVDGEEVHREEWFAAATAESVLGWWWDMVFHQELGLDCEWEGDDAIMVVGARSIRVQCPEGGAWSVGEIEGWEA